MKIGIILAIEIDAIMDYYGNPELLEEYKTFKTYRIKKDNNEIYVVQTGMGLVLAAAGLQYLIDKFDVDYVVNFGVVGGLTNKMSKLKTCVVNRVVHYRYDVSGFMPKKIGELAERDSIFLETNKELVNKALEVCPDLHTVTCCSGDKFVAEAADKASLHDLFEGDVCDMESAGLLLTADLNNKPLIILKAVSDGLSDGSEGFYKELKKAAYNCLMVADKVISSL